MQDVTLLFLQNRNEILLAMKKRGYGVGKWNGVGGKVEPGESIIEAVVREAQEEVGIVPLQPEKIGDLYITRQGALLHVHVFVATDWYGFPRESDEMQPVWFEAGKIPNEKMWATDQYWLPYCIHHIPFEAHIQQDQHVYVELGCTEMALGVC